MIVVRIAPTFAAFREKARTLLSEGYSPDDVQWASEGEQSLFGEVFAGEAAPKGEAVRPEGEAG